ncbi:hypothetical protein PHYBLDRAFT_184736 [Phycomyces blakesleeanus NRRL 1555(-)]|uniref:Uncharacterized protein n=1 Tax=Phycomyces blakesleeanus (strain ATCC 8743b / DSM 1359 / FGSC 10004 / NBRC 33097 / NRRL 1555) TaxID=763407 RepID=A0A167Q935_PHYB8|nr:hypothetical protein PHYBLDRAFT_184736 [Phycomyces blakesleeanus NRRL 1555(-)]OAD79296.1 hypothetical protein PHYBLDRAFT_184736 [Phycomyces blakesleeanus NRRL 1555(-)]|eukprot:XP_018297336.1 hypothetical protein PHYBLDRAFT_184736 [Phycomyces blakesleeanus NRRL 1555(-)]
MANRTPLELEQDIAAIDQTLSTVSEIRSSLHYFTRLIQAEKKEPQYVQNFSIRLNAIKRELNKLSIESEGLRGPLEYAQQLSGAGNFSWPMIKEAASKEAGDEDIADENNSDKQKEAGAMIKEKAESVLGQLSSVVLDRAQTQKPNRFITSHIQYWMLNDKPTNLGMIVEIDEEEKETLVGSTCHIKVTVQKVLVASLSLEYESKSNTLILQQFDIRGPREEPLISL